MGWPLSFLKPLQVLRWRLAKPPFEAPPETGNIAEPEKVPDTLHRQLRVGQIMRCLLLQDVIPDRLIPGAFAPEPAH